MTPEFTHCALHVRDLDQSIAFYEATAGFASSRSTGRVMRAPCGWRMEMMTASCSSCSAADLIVRKARTT